MGQSQSLIETQKAIPIRPARVFGFLFFQRAYGAVLKSDIDQANTAYDIKRNKWAQEHFEKK